MSVVVVYEESHGMIAIAADYKAALRFLISNCWVDGYTQISDDDGEEYDIIDLLGKDWKSQLFAWDLETFDEHISEIQMEVKTVYE